MKHILSKKKFIRDKEGRCKLTEGSIHQGLTIINVYTSNDRAPKYMKQKWTELKGEIDSSTRAGDYDTHFQ